MEKEINLDIVDVDRIFIFDDFRNNIRNKDKILNEYCFSEEEKEKSLEDRKKNCYVYLKTCSKEQCEKIKDPMICFAIRTNWMFEQFSKNK